ncbi:D-2-hydroxyacid dehydrogenase family protein [Roseomonas alkaliterrae]|uniref:Phosphoglycerate dehydrogenase-like enzyme n=1 Tax=Neoroseomonas alkaliterrae TaxID=1452450 RepID=A0A840Y549_9PROT|nr:D-2-hydroxyacid dehydrogenase family protein [Neoroseomonas alkaliterrae]MBB5689752.1 phosphoglycerate dehydrogenase-like enzyme [Neoroseomonas alkaliterrae]MBR0674896.1 D-2-hydroxyacid dehydrogenase family protein [Neoroseomonas alkaliterrae]
MSQPPAPLKRLAILDDYQGVAMSMGPWERLAGMEITAFRDTLTDREALVRRLEPFDAILAMRERTPFPRALIERLPNLRLLITTAARNRSIDAAACAERGIVFCGTPSHGDPTVDITWGLIIGLMRDLPAQQQALREGRWQTSVGTALEGQTLGVVGLGKLGGRVAKVAQAFGMKVIAWSQNLTEERAAEIGAQRVDKQTLFREADVVTLHLILSDRSRGIVGAEDIARMKPTAFIVNTSRGPLIDQDALIAALKEGRIAGAGIDVFDTEPLPPGHPILSAPNTILTPHLGYVSQQNYRAYYAGCVEAIEAFNAGAPVRVIAP